MTGQGYSARVVPIFFSFFIFSSSCMILTLCQYGNYTHPLTRCQYVFEESLFSYVFEEILFSLSPQYVRGGTARLSRITRLCITRRRSCISSIGTLSRRSLSRSAFSVRGIGMQASIYTKNGLWNWYNQISYILIKEEYSPDKNTFVHFYNIHLSRWQRGHHPRAVPAKLILNGKVIVL